MSGVPASCVAAGIAGTTASKNASVTGARPFFQMVEIRDESGAFIFDEQTQQPILKATKCDLCADQPTGPACQNACPHDALVRIDMLNVDSVKQWLGR